MIDNPIMVEIETFLASVNEDYENFIFERIEPWCNQVTKMTISKEILKKALFYYQIEHKEEYEELLKKDGRDLKNENCN